MKTPELLISEIQIITVKAKDDFVTFASSVIINFFISGILPFIPHLKIQITTAP